MFIYHSFTVLFLYSMTTNTNSRKHLNIISEPLGDKMVGELAGISQALAEKMAAKGFDKVRFASANYVLKFYLLQPLFHFVWFP